MVLRSGKDGGEIQAGIPLRKGLNLLKSSLKTGIFQLIKLNFIL